MMNAGHKDKVSAALDAGDISGAVNLALETVKSAPKDTDARRLLIDLLILSADFERADKQADILSNTAGDLTLGMALLRGRLRAAKAREAWFRDGAVPVFPGEPTPRDQIAMLLGVALREGDATRISEALLAMTTISQTSGLSINGNRVAEFRDVDDRLPHAVEVLCSDGSYMWVDFDRIETIKFNPVSSVRDLVWRPAKLRLNDGSETDVVVCVTYCSATQSDEEKLARITNWKELAGGAVVGVGQKAYLAGDDAVYSLDVNMLAKTN
jgi:type VI secretion system protein ImpE